MAAAAAGFEMVRNRLPCRIYPCEYVASSLRFLLSHLTHSHSEERNLFLKCDLEGCSVRCQTVSAFRSHVRRYHRAMWAVYDSSVLSVQNIATTFMEDEVANYERLDGFYPYDSFDDRYDATFRWLSGESLRLRMAMEHLFETPTSTVVRVHAEIRHFILSIMSQVESLVSKKLADLGQDEVMLSKIFDFYNFSNSLYVGKKEVKTALKKYQYIEPVAVHLSSNDDPSIPTVLEEEQLVADADNEGLRSVEDDSELQSAAVEAVPTAKASGIMHYIPILKTLERYLTHEDVVDSICREKIGDRLERYSSGALFHMHPIFKINPGALRIILYTDEFEVCNPLGSNRGKHKLFAVYFSVGNIEQHCLSDLSSIHLALLCEYPNVVQYSYKQVLQPLIDDLKLLETEGITVVTQKGHEHHWIGGVSFVCGDNLSQNALGGFRRCFTSGKCCRFCMADYSTFRTLLSEQDCILRSAEAHAVHVESVLRNDSLIPVYGVTGPSPLDELQIGSIIDILPPDIMHDCLEGLLSQHMTLLIRGLNTRKTVKLKETIRLLSLFPLGRNDKRNKHPGVSPKFSQKKYNLIGSASQKWNLFHIFSLAVGPSVPEDDAYWKLYLLFNHICDIIFAVIIEHDWVLHLQKLIEEHQRTWVSLYPEISVYKWHVFLHIVRVIVKLGPPRHLWTMRFEGFHLFFKRMAVKLRNFNCISKTLSERFEKRRAMEYSGEDILPPRIQPMGKQTCLTLREAPQLVRDSILGRYNSAHDECLVNVKGVKVNGVRCYINDFIVIDVGGDGSPIFLNIKFIYILRGNVVFLGQLTFTVAWRRHIHAYEVHVSQDISDFACVGSENICSPQTLDMYELGGKKYIKMYFQAVGPHNE